MNSKRLYWLQIGILCVLVIGLISSAYGFNKILTNQGTKVTGLKAKSLALSEELGILAKAKKDLIAYAPLEKIAKAVVPQDKNQAEAVREIVNIAEANNVSLSAINFPSSNLGNSLSSKDSTSQLTVVPNIAGVYQLTITIIGDTNKPVQYNKFLSFLSALERNRRTAQVSTMTIQPSTTDKNLLSFTLTLNEYIKP